MSCFRTMCKHYDVDKNGSCDLPENLCLNKSKYTSKYGYRDCVYFNDKKSALKRCTVLNCTYFGAPCEAPRLDRDGNPVMCTFYKRKDD